MATQFNGQLNSGIIYNSMYNAIIAIYQIKQHFTDSYSLVDRFRKEGSEYGDKLVYMTLDSIPVHDWTNDGEAANLLALDRNKKQHEELDMLFVEGKWFYNHILNLKKSNGQQL